MRIRFDLKPLEPFTFLVAGQRYTFTQLQPLARKERPATLVHELVYKLPEHGYIYLTVVGDEDQTFGYGIARGWYVAETMQEEDALWLIDALKPFTQLYR